MASECRTVGRQLAHNGRFLWRGDYMRFAGQLPKRTARRYAYDQNRTFTNSQENAEMGRRFRKWLDVQDYAPGTQDRCSRVVRGLCAFIGNKTLREVTPMD